MKKSLNQAIAYLLLAGILTSVSCGGTSSETHDTTVLDTSTTTSTPEPIVDPNADDLGDLCFNGETITFYSRDHDRYNDEISVEESNGDIVNDAIYDREIRVEERLNVKLETVREGDHLSAFTNLQKLVMAGDDTYDIQSSSVYKNTPGAATGIFYDLNLLDNIDLTKPYYAQDFIKQTTVGGRNYVVTGDIALSIMRYSFCMFFNKTLLDDYDIANPYDSVRDGTWTHEKLNSIVTEIYQDLNGNGDRDEEDLYGLGTSNIINVDAYISAYDMQMIDFKSDGTPYLAINVEKFSDIINKLYKQNWESTGVYCYGSLEIKGDVEMDTICRYFSEDHLVFIQNWIYALEGEYFRSMASDFGVLPYPKYDESQENYYTYQHDQIGTFTIPVNAKNPEISAAVIEAMSSDSRKNLLPIFYDNALKNKYSRDSDTAEMIDLIHNNRLFDPAFLYVSAMGGLMQTPRNLLCAKNSNFVSEYESKKTMYEENLNNIFAQFNEMQSSQG